MNKLSILSGGPHMRQRLLRADLSLSTMSRISLCCVSLALTAVLGWLDFITGYRVSLSLFYMVPVGLAAWYGGRRLGIVFSLVGSLVWLIAEIGARGGELREAVNYWNALIRMGFFFSFTWLLSTMHQAFSMREILSMTDSLTGAANARAFLKRGILEVERSRRSGKPLSLAFADLDNFKNVNDEQGHAAGDQLLQAVARNVTAVLRKTDFLARLGGDEFAILLPETNEAQARQVAQRIADTMTGLAKTNNWPVSFSMGVVTFRRPTVDVAALITEADALMYQAKAAGKNQTAFRTL